MATEGNWVVLPTDFSRSVDIGDGTILHLTMSNETPDIGGDSTEEMAPYSYMDIHSVQKGSHSLFIMKEQLVQFGWQVVSSSARTNFGETTLLPEEALGSKTFDWDNGVPDTVISGTSGINTYKQNKNFFYASGNDRWLPNYGSSSIPIDTSQLKNFTNTMDSGVPAYTVIAPGSTVLEASNLSSLNSTDMIAKGLLLHSSNTSNTSDTRKSLYSRYYRTAANTYHTIGRSWILLKAPENFNEMQSARTYPSSLSLSSSYHVLLEYASTDSSKWDWRDSDNRIYPLSGNMGYYSTGFAENDYAGSNQLGNHINIYIFPDYGDKYTNLKNLNDPYDGYYNPSQFIRPSHKYEICNMSRTLFSTDAGVSPITNSNYKIFSSIKDSKFVSNIMHDTTYGSTILIGSDKGREIRSLIMLGTIADPLSQEVTFAKSGYHPGTKLFGFWSKFLRGGRKITGWKAVPQLNNDDNIGYNKTWEVSALNGRLKRLLAQGLTGETADPPNTTPLYNSIFDSSQELSFIQYYRKYQADSNYESSYLNSCFPAFGIRTRYNQAINGKSSTATPSYVNNRATAALLLTEKFSGITKDYTYVEWPLPLVDIISIGTDSPTTRVIYSNYVFAGRIMDIKLAPTDAPNGILAKDPDPSNPNYDRILLDGLWFPYNASFGLDL